MQQWEYDVIYINRIYSNKEVGVFDRLDSKGKQGWELVSIVNDRAKIAKEDGDLIAVFKRPITYNVETGQSIPT